MTSEVPDEVARRFAAASTAAGVTVEEAVVAALTERARHHPTGRPVWSVFGIGEDRAGASGDQVDPLDAFFVSAASGRTGPFDIHRERIATAEAKRALGI